MDMGRTPSRILGDHLEDQLPNFFRNPRSAADSFSRFTEHGPIEPESSLVPPAGRFRLDQKERFFPSGREANCYDPEQFVQRLDPQPRMFAFEDGKLLAQGEVLQHEAAPGPESS